MAILLTLSALAVLAGIAVGRRTYPESRAEAALAACLVALALILLPIQVLGWAGRLDRAMLAGAVLLLSSVTLAAAVGGRPRGTRLSAFAADVLAIVRLPVDTLAEAWRARSSALVLFAFACGLLLWTAWLAWLAPSGSWDGLWYHEPMVGFAIQNRGFSLVEVPVQLEWINGYPRNTENLMLWATIFSDRRLIDAVPSAMGGVSLLAFVCLARPHGNWTSGAVGLGCVLLTIPGVILQMRSTYVDVSVLAGYLAALHFVTRPGFGVRDLWLAGIGLGFLGGTKSSGIAYVALLGAVGLARALQLARRAGRRALMHALGATAVVAILAAPTYVRNWILHDNPIWPLRYESRLLGRTFEGPHDLTDMQWPLPQVLEEMFGAPRPGQDYHDTRRHAYGYGLTFVGLPLLAIACGAAIARALRAGAARDRLALRREGRLGLVLALGAFPLWSSPAYYWARYALPTPAVALVAIHALLARPRMRSLGEAAIGAMGVINLITLFWAVPAWDVPIATALELARLAPEERVHAQVSQNLLPAHASRRREERIGPGDVVAFDERISFLGNLWNEQMSNRVVFVPCAGRESWAERVEALGAAWAVAGRGGPCEQALRSREGRWREIARGRRDEVIWERVDPSPAPPPGGALATDTEAPSDTDRAPQGPPLRTLFEPDAGPPPDRTPP